MSDDTPDFIVEATGGAQIRVETLDVGDTTKRHCLTTDSSPAARAFREEKERIERHLYKLAGRHPVLDAIEARLPEGVTVRLDGHACGLEITVGELDLDAVLSADHAEEIERAARALGEALLGAFPRKPRGGEYEC